uniref:ATP synthase F0 subunit 6 n=1 Tax=Cordax unidentatus TaxID=3021430 RepID=UPI0030FE15B4|nr:ATP synthase F0 subunit 6 [Cordax unidentatus]
MVNLFSVFDPTTGLFHWSLNWGSLILGLGFVPAIFWVLPTRWNSLWMQVSKTLHGEFKLLIGEASKGATMLFIGLFFFILANNFLGLFPYIFTGTSHLTITLTLGLPLWLSFIMFGWWNHTMHMLAHLVPQGTPPVLMPFMVCIETISNTIRPGTLAVRLMANMVAGHLLLTLLGNTGASLGSVMVGGLLMIQMALLGLELAVAVIQSYVFAVLSTLYSKEAVH